MDCESYTKSRDRDSVAANRIKIKVKLFFTISGTVPVFDTYRTVV